MKEFMLLIRTQGDHLAELSQEQQDGTGARIEVRPIKVMEGING